MNGGISGLAGFTSYNPAYWGNNSPTVDSMLDAASNVTNSSGNGFWGNLFGNGGIIGGLGTLGGLATGVLQGITGLQQMGLANKAYGLAKKQFNFQKALANRNLANQAKIINNTYDNAAQVAAGMIGGTDASGNYGFTNPAVVANHAAAAKQKHVDGTPI